MYIFSCCRLTGWTDHYVYFLMLWTHWADRSLCLFSHAVDSLDGQIIMFIFSRRGPFGSFWSFCGERHSLSYKINMKGKFAIMERGSG